MRIGHSKDIQNHHHKRATPIELLCTGLVSGCFLKPPKSYLASSHGTKTSAASKEFSGDKRAALL